jgi:O-antigen/teichoic acid export membrane protein
MSIGRRLIGDTIVYGVAFALARVLSFVLVPILTRAFTPEDFGAYDFSTSFSRALLVLGTFGMDTSIALLLQDRDEAGQRRAVSSYLRVQAIWGALVAAPAAIAAPWISSAIFGNRGHATLVTLAAGLAFAQAICLATASVVKWKRDPRAYLLLTVGAVGLATAFAAGAAILGKWGAEGALTGALLGMAVFAPVGLVVCRRYMGAQASLTEMLACLRLGLPFAAIVASEYLLFPLGVRLLLVGSSGLAGVGIFGAASTVCLAIMVINESFANAWWPYAISAEGAPRIREDTRRVMRLYAFLLMLPVGAMTLAAEPLVAVVLGHGSFEAAAALIGPIAFAYWLKSVRQNVSVVLVVARRIWVRALFNFVAFAGSLAFASAFTPSWGAAGAAWGFVAGEAVGLAIQSLAMQHVYDHRLDVGSLALMAGAFLALIALVGMVVPEGIWAIFLLRCGLGAAFLGVLLSTVPLAELRQMLIALGHFTVGSIRR